MKSDCSSNGNIPQWEKKGKLEANKGDDVNVGDGKNDRWIRCIPKLQVKESI